MTLLLLIVAVGFLSSFLGSAAAAEITFRRKRRAAEAPNKRLVSDWDQRLARFHEEVQREQDERTREMRN